MRTGRSAKSALKRGVKRSLAVLGRLGARGKDASRILTYHSVGRRDHEMNVTPAAFRQQMEWLAETHQFIPAADAAGGRPGVAITFDDGYEDILRNAAPLLHERHIPATVYVVPGRMGGRLDHDRDAAHSRLLTWEQVRELESLGWTIGAHTLTHRRLASLDKAVQREEICGSVECLAHDLGHQVESFAYPFGSVRDYDAVSVELAKESGVQFAVSNRYGVIRPGADRWTLRRIWIDATDDLALFKAKVGGRLDVLAALDSPLGALARRLLNRLLKTG